MKLFTALVVTAISAPGAERPISTMVFELRVAVALARITSTTMLIETFADMLFSDAQTFPVIVPEMVTSAETGGTIHSTATRLGDRDPGCRPGDGRHVVGGDDTCAASGRQRLRCPADGGTQEIQVVRSQMGVGNLVLRNNCVAINRHHRRHGRHAGRSAFRSRTGQPSMRKTRRFHSGVCRVSNRWAWSDTRRSNSSTLTVNERTS